jgi:hypothetical protein
VGVSFAQVALGKGAHCFVVSRSLRLGVNRAWRKTSQSLMTFLSLSLAPGQSENYWTTEERVQRGIIACFGRETIKSLPQIEFTKE